MIQFKFQIHAQQDDILRFHRNCQAVRDCGGLKTMCELVSLTYSENVLERTMWALGNLAIDNK